jgi:hypothetical protein
VSIDSQDALPDLADTTILDDSQPLRPSFAYLELDKLVLGEGRNVQQLSEPIQILDDPPEQFPTCKNISVLVKHPHGFAPGSDAKANRRKMTV